MPDSNYISMSFLATNTSIHKKLKRFLFSASGKKAIADAQEVDCNGNHSK
jgi:hypothetical protein